MKFLIDESVEYSLVANLRSLGFDVTAIAEGNAGLDDEGVLKIANREKRIIITNDKDFGELVYKYRFPHEGIIFFRLRIESKEAKLKRLKILFEKYSERMPGKFIVITDATIRLKKGFSA